MKRPIRYFERCSCNPSNGGSGMCGCTMAQNIVEYEEYPYIYNAPIRSETCYLCLKILSTSEDLYWHLKSHAQGLLPNIEKRTS